MTRKGVMLGTETARRVLRLTGQREDAGNPVRVTRRTTGGGGESKFFRYTLTADMGTSSTTWVAAATANLVGMGNEDNPTGVVVIDTLGNAAWQTTGGRGICVLAGDDYFVLTPECEPDEEVIPDPP
jgi:hypothetical protein